MSATADHVRACGPSEKIDTLLAKVEALMFEALRLGAGFNTPGQIDARSAAAYHLRSGGQRVRARLALASGLASGLSHDDVLCIATSSELLHNASLIHDDIQDRDSHRRGQPALWSKYGSNLAICTGDYLLSAAYGVLCTFSQPRLLPAMLALIHERTSTAIDGQCADLSMRDDLPDGIRHYVKIAKAKSGALLSLPLELTLLASGRGDAVPLARKACENFAVSYQVLDDLQDIQIDSESDPREMDVSKNLNVVFIYRNINRISGEESPVDAEALSKDLGLQHLLLCEESALKMPHGTGTFVLDLSSELRRMFEVFSSSECC
jgi:geranylgeranyl pyrophosphate synthase